MHGKNISDMIEKYLKQILSSDEEVEIRRSEIANLFHVVPSQINYVIKTRFTIQNGYVVESKRGGGGYIRIEKVRLLDNIDILDSAMQMIGESTSLLNGNAIVKSLFRDGLINERERSIILASISHRALNCGNSQVENQFRATILTSILNRLRYDN